MISTKDSTNFTLAIDVLRFDRVECQALRTLLNFLNFVVMILALSKTATGIFKHVVQHSGNQGAPSSSFQIKTLFFLGLKCLFLPHMEHDQRFP